VGAWRGRAATHETDRMSVSGPASVAGSRSAAGTQPSERLDMESRPALQRANLRLEVARHLWRLAHELEGSRPAATPTVRVRSLLQSVQESCGQRRRSLRSVQVTIAEEPGPCPRCGGAMGVQKTVRRCGRTLKHGVAISTGEVSVLQRRCATLSGALTGGSERWIFRLRRLDLQSFSRPRPARKAGGCGGNRRRGHPVGRR
jgi:hypothetical protein